MSTLAYPDPVSQSVSNLVTDRHKSWLDEVRWWSRRPCDLTTHSWRGPCRRAISSATSVISCVTCAPIWLDAVCAVMTTPLTSRRSVDPDIQKPFNSPCWSERPARYAAEPSSPEDTQTWWAAASYVTAAQTVPAVCATADRRQAHGDSGRFGFRDVRPCCPLRPA
jgi:hypothetical protein